MSFSSTLRIAESELKVYSAIKHLVTLLMTIRGPGAVHPENASMYSEIREIRRMAIDTSSGRSMLVQLFLLNLSHTMSLNWSSRRCRRPEKAFSSMVSSRKLAMCITSNVAGT